jgi:hypothetical protein
LAGLLLDQLEKFSSHLSKKNNNENWHLGYITLFLLSIFFSICSVAFATQLKFEKTDDLTEISDNLIDLD